MDNLPERLIADAAPAASTAPGRTMADISAFVKIRHSAHAASVSPRAGLPIEGTPGRQVMPGTTVGSCATRAAASKRWS